MQIYCGESTVDEDGRLMLDHLPFSKGESVRVFIAAPNRPLTPDSLHGTVLKYERPFDPVAEDEWEACQ